MENNISHVDKNFNVEVSVRKDGLNFYNIKSNPFKIYGLHTPKEIGAAKFKRMPEDVAKKVNDGVATLYTNTSGGRVRFSTDSDTIVLKAEISNITRVPHLSLTGACSFDIYEDFPELQNSRYVATFIPPYNVSDSFEYKIKLGSCKKRYFTIHFPLYCDVSSVFIGLKDTATLDKGMEYKKLLPIVYYGNSVTQGGCASRPGNSYPNIIGRRLNVDFINLGFSGSGKAEETMVDYLASLDMSVFVCDYDHNAPNPDYLKATHCNLYEKIRADHPQLPIIIMSKCDFVYGEENSVRRRDIIYETFRYAKSQGDKNVYFMDGASIYSGDYANIAVIDRVHPSDIGFSLIADTLEEIILRAINNQ